MARVIGSTPVTLTVAELSGLQAALSGFPIFLAPDLIREGFNTAGAKLGAARIWQADGDTAKSEVKDADLADLGPEFGSVKPGLYIRGENPETDAYYDAAEAAQRESEAEPVGDDDEALMSEAREF